MNYLAILGVLFTVWITWKTICYYNDSSNDKRQAANLNVAAAVNGASKAGNGRCNYEKFAEFLSKCGLLKGNEISDYEMSFFKETAWEMSFFAARRYFSCDYNQFADRLPRNYYLFRDIKLLILKRFDFQKHFEDYLSDGKCPHTPKPTSSPTSPPWRCQKCVKSVKGNECDHEQYIECIYSEYAIAVRSKECVCTSLKSGKGVFLDLPSNPKKCIDWVDC